MRPSSTARRYAEAAFDVARQDGDVEGWLVDLQTATQELTNATAANYFRDPGYATEEKLRTAERVFENLRPHVRNLLKILVSRYRLHLLPTIVYEFERLEREARGVADAEVIVARAIDEAEKSSIEDRLSRVTGKSVAVQTRVDPRILGGMIVRIGDKLIDASVAGRLERLRHELAM